MTQSPRGRARPKYNSRPRQQRSQQQSQNQDQDQANHPSQATVIDPPFPFLPPAQPNNSYKLLLNGKANNVTVRIMCPSACEDIITAAQKFFYHQHGFQFSNRILLARALQPKANEIIALRGDKAQGDLLAGTLVAFEEGRETVKPGQLATRNYYQHKVANVVASNDYQAAMCIKHDLYQFMFIDGGEGYDNTGNEGVARFEEYGYKKLADCMEGLMGVIRQGGEESGHWEDSLKRWMIVFELDWDAALRLQIQEEDRTRNNWG